MPGRYELNQELVNDPLGRDYAGMSDSEAADALNAPDRPRIVPLSTRQLLEWGAQSQRLLKIDDAALNHADADVRNLGMAAAELIRREDAELNMANPLHVGMVDSLVAASVLEAADKDSLVTMATQQISRARELGFPPIRPGDVERARS